MLVFDDDPPPPRPGAMTPSEYWLAEMTQRPGGRALVHHVCRRTGYDARHGDELGNVRRLGLLGDGSELELLLRARRLLDVLRAVSRPQDMNGDR